jgi:para-aminobenzoate synthetase component II
MNRILVVDNYDSFVYNLVQYLGQLGSTVVVARNDAFTEEELVEISTGNFRGERINGILLSPGPGTPDDSGVCLRILRDADTVPVLGVCLGHQAFGAVFGATVKRAPELLHGKTSDVFHDGVGVLTGLPNPFTAARYHSLVVEESTLPPSIEVTGRTEAGIVMAMRHREKPIQGVQFHPESVLTEVGHLVLANWLALCGAPDALSRAPELVAAMSTRAAA